MLCDFLSSDDPFFQALDRPPDEFSVVPFWFINDRVRRGKADAAVRDFKEKGISAFVLHPRIGLPRSVRYLSARFFRLMGVFVRAAARHGLKVILYDEGMYPSGSASGQVVKSNPRFGSVGLFLTDTPAGTVVAHTDAGYLIAAPSGGRLRGLHYGEDDGQRRQPYSVDILNPEAVDRFVELTYDRYYRAFKNEFGRTIIGFFTDEPDILGRGAKGCFPWTYGLEREIEAAGGRVEELISLFTGEENRSTAVYRRVLLHREKTVYYKKLRDWCRAHNVFLTGHPAAGDDVEKADAFDVPGQDLVFRRVAPGKEFSGRESAAAKASADAAAFAGCRRNMNEFLGVCARDGHPFYLPPGDIKWFTDYLAVRGVNMFIPHAFFWSLREPRLYDRPPDVGPHTLWWPHYGAYAGYVRRLSYLLTDIGSQPAVAVPCSNGSVPAEEVAPLYRGQIDFVYLPEAAARASGLPVCTDGVSAETCEKAIIFSCPRPDIRVKRFVKAGRQCLFVVNAGDNTVTDMAEIPGRGGLTACDLWRGRAVSLSADEREGRLRFRLTLYQRESLLLVIGRSPFPPAPAEVPLSPVFRFKYEDPSRYIKVYEAEVTLGRVTGGETLYANADGTAEYYINGCFAGAALWPPYRLAAAEWLRPGRNTVEMVVTADTAVRYGDDMPYGLNKLAT